MTKIERETPPRALVQPCAMPTFRSLTTNQAIIDSRQDWITSWSECDSKYQRLIDWNLDKKPASPQ